MLLPLSPLPPPPPPPMPPLLPMLPQLVLESHQMPLTKVRRARHLANMLEGTA
jgi:hypothetical protein